MHTIETLSGVSHAWSIPGEIQLEEVVAALAIWIIVVAPIMGTMVVVVVVTVVVNMTDELLLIDVVIGVVVTLTFVVPVSNVLKMPSGVVVEALFLGIGVEVVMNMNVSTGVMTALEFPMPIP